MKDESVITNYNLFNDNELDNTIRPETIDEYIGQNDVKEKNHPKENEMWKYMYKKIDECLKNWYFITNKTAALCG